eukprot:1376-Heterococcus_DN1.PRE.2
MLMRKRSHSVTSSATRCSRSSASCGLKEPLRSVPAPAKHTTTAHSISTCSSNSSSSSSCSAIPQPSLSEVRAYADGITTTTQTSCCARCCCSKSVVQTVTSSQSEGLLPLLLSERFS